MTPTTYQTPEIRDSNDNIIKQGSFGKNTALANSTNDGWIDYVANDLEFLYGLAKDEVVPVSELPSTGDTNKTYLLTTTGVCYRWDGTEWVEISSSEAVSRADSAAYLAEQWATKTSGTVDGTEYSAKYYAEQAQDTADDLSESLEQIATNTANIEENAENIATNTGNIAQNTTDIDIAEKRIGNIEKLLQGNLYDYQTDTDSKYTKTVPQGAMPYASLEQIGGKTLVWNQLAPNGYSKSGAGTVALNEGVSIVKGHKYLISRTLATADNSELYFYVRQGGKGYYMRITGTATATIETAPESGTSNGTTSAVDGNAWIYQGVTANTVTNLMLIDLTLMYGAGNEPTTVAEFQQMFPAPYYAFTQGTLLSAGVTEVVSKDSNNATLQTIPIPAEIQALEGYGWSAGSVYNYIDYERKVFVKCVDRVDMGSIEWSKGSTPQRFAIAKFETLEGAKTPSSNTTYANILCKDYRVGYGNDTSTDMIISLSTSGTLSVYDSVKYASMTRFEFATSMSGVYLYYELATPVEVDISAYITDDNLIEVEAGGTLTFPNSNGNDYRIDVPSAETYMVDLQSALGE